ncbi:MAG: NADP-dependent malic enzyme [Cyclobacteriaceae bacterium]|nr:NADP-dependent malic enzyme [Cyclobacteriaceae bacterium]
MDKLFRKDAFNYHALGRPGKLEVVPTKPYSTQRDLSLAYSPGVADPCLAIDKNPDDVYKYTMKRNLVAVISNGTAVLGLGDIGPLAGKPVMEGKGLLFKVFADIDVFDIEVDAKDPELFINTVKAIAPTFGGINLEDIKSPECFEIEERLKEALDIPVMHDDQHGTAIITSAGLINALEIAGKKIDKIKVVVNGAGAAAISCTKLYLTLGVKKENIVMVDSKGVLNEQRTDLNEAKKQFITKRKINTLAEALKGADVFLGLSVEGVMTDELLLSMTKNPIVFALANPNPEIPYDKAIAVREDVIIATGRSDFPNQINNVLGFPYIFRGALDVRARKINEEMKIAVAKALAELAKEPVPEEVNIAYNVQNLKYGRGYFIPKPNDPRLMERIAPAVAKAAMESGVAREPITNWNTYIEDLRKRMGLSNPLKKHMTAVCKQNPKRVVLADAENYNVLKAAEIVVNQGLAELILLGNKKVIADVIRENELELHDVQIIDPQSTDEDERIQEYAEVLYAKRQRKGMTMNKALEIIRHRNYYAPMLVELGKADAIISGFAYSYPDAIAPALQIIGRKANTKVASGMYIVVTKGGPLFLSDCTVNLNPDKETLIEIVLQTAEAVKRFNIEPNIALLSYTNFGSVRSELSAKLMEVVSYLHKEYPKLMIDGEMQANVALDPDLMQQSYPFSKLIERNVNTLIFPDLGSANIAYKLLNKAAKFDVIGPVLSGMKKPVHILQMGSSVNEIVDMIMIAVIDAQKKIK